MSSHSTSMEETDSKRPKLEIGILTHNGTHHADEALAVNLLRKLPRFKNLPLTRTRDPALIQQAQIVVDVGAEYDEKRQRFDHHQRGFQETFDDNHKTKLSSAGLVWKHFGQEIISTHLSLSSDSPTIPLLHLKLYDDFIEAIDGIDNGIPQYTSTPAYKSKTDLSSRIGYLNPNWNETSDEEDGMKRFEKASDLAGNEFFDRLDYSHKAWLPGREIVEKALEKRKNVEGGDQDGRILVFDDFASWKDHLFTLESDLSIPEPEKPLYVIYPDESSKWRIQCVPISIDSFTSRKPLPEAWRGLRDETLSEKSGIQNSIFVHASGFIGGNQTKEGALKMARKALSL